MIEFSILGMFDRDRSGQIDLNEFQALWTYIHQWKAVFDQFDRDRSGSIDVNELNNGKIPFKINFCNLPLVGSTVGPTSTQFVCFTMTYFNVRLFLQRKAYRYRVVIRY